MLLYTIGYNATPLTAVFSQLFTFYLTSSHSLNAIVCIIKSFLCHNIKQAVISYHGSLCHDMSYVTTIAASLLCNMLHNNYLLNVN